MLKSLQYEQLKKQKAKAQKTGGEKKKDLSTGTKEEEASVVRESGDGGEDIAEKSKTSTDGAEDEQTATNDEQKIENGEANQSEQGPEAPAKPPHNRQPSLSLQSKLRSSSFRRTSVSQGPLSPNGTKSPDLPVLPPDGDSVNSIYRRQAARLDELEKENRRLAKDLQEAEKRWRHAEAELEELREASGEAAELKSRAQKAEVQMEEYQKLVRVLSPLVKSNEIQY